MRVLYLAPLLPAPSGSGGKRAIFNHLQDMLGDPAQIDCIFIDVEGEAQGQLDAFARFAPRVFGRALPKFGAGIQGKLAGIASLLTNPLPRSLAVVASGEARVAIALELASGRYDAILVDHLNAYGLIRGLHLQVPVVYVAHNVESAVLAHQEARLPRGSALRLFAALDLARMRKIEGELLSLAAKVVIIGAADAALPEMRAVGSKLALWPELPQIKSGTWAPSNRKNLLFVGSAKYFPNKDAIEWLVHELMPELRKRDPAITLHVAGTRADELGLTGDPAGTRFHGFVSDAELDALHQRTDLFLCPVVLGAGIKIKLLEAASYGLPTAATAESLAGIDFLDGVSLRIDRTAPGDSAREIAALLGDTARLERMSRDCLQGLHATIAGRVSLIDQVRSVCIRN